MKSSTRTGLFVLEASLLLGVLGDALLRVTPWGLNVLLWVGALAVAYGALVRRRRVRLGGEGRWLVPAALAVAFAFAWRDSLTLKTIDAFAVLALLALGQLRARAGRVRLAGVVEYGFAALFAAATALVGPLLLVAQDIGWKEIPRGGWSRHAFAVVRGLVIALPLVLVFGALFVAADAVYEGLVQRTFNIDGEVIVSHAVMFCFLSWLSAGYLRGAFVGPERAAGASLPAHVALSFDGWQSAAATTGETSDEAATGETRGEAAGAKDESDGASGEAAGESLLTRGGRRALSLGVVEVGVVLGLLNALFFSFVAVQLRYFFGGAGLVQSTTGLTYAEYARRGFFELVWVAALVLPLLLGAHWLLRKENPAHERAFRVLASGLLAMLFVIMVSAVGRMRLYQSEYGQTELRLYTTAFMGWLGLVFVWFALTVLRGRRERFACGALVSALMVLAALHFVNPDDLIVRTNAGLTRQGRAFDACYASALSADAAPALVEILPSLPPHDRSMLAGELLSRWPAEGGDWRTWNVSRSRAGSAVAARVEMLREMTASPPSQNCWRGGFHD